MLALLNPRVWLAIGLAVLLAASHFGAWKTGRAGVRADWDRDIADRTAQALAASEAARAKEQALQAENTRIRSTYAKETARAQTDHAAAVADLDSLLHATGTTRSQAGADPAPTAGADDAARARHLLEQCAVSITALAEAADTIEARLTGLQDYVRTVCLQEQGGALFHAGTSSHVRPSSMRPAAFLPMRSM